MTQATHQEHRGAFRSRTLNQAVALEGTRAAPRALELRTIEALIAPLTPEAFLGKISKKQVYVFHRSVERIIPAFDLAEFEQLLWSHEGRISDHLRVIRQNAEVMAPRPYANKDLFRWAIEQYAEGGRIEFLDLHELITEFAEMAGTAAARLSARMTVSAQLIGPRTAERTRRVIAPADIIIVQTSGCSRWRVAPSSDPLSKKEVNASLKESTESLHDYGILSPGDSIYLPKSVAADVETPSPHSLQLEFACHPATREDYVRSLVEIVSELDPELRKTAKSRTSDELTSDFDFALNRIIKQAASRRVQELATQRMHLNVLSDLRPIPGHHLEGIAEAPALTLDTVVAKVPGTAFVLIERGEHALLFAPGLGMVPTSVQEPGHLAFPISASSLLKTIMETEAPFSPYALPAIYSERARLDAVRCLIEAGVLYACTPC